MVIFRKIVTKSVLIVKNSDDLPKARHIFKGVNIEITTEGQRHLGAAIGTDKFRTEYVSAKISKWVKDINKLADFAVEEPQSALAAFGKGICHRWRFLQRTISNIDNLFEPLEEAIRHKLIPSIFGREVSDLERRILALPFRLGGLGIRNPVETASREYAASRGITKQLTDRICEQNQDIHSINISEVKSAKEAMLLNRNLYLQDECNQICNLLTEEQKRYFKAAAEKGASSWLSTLPLKQVGYTLNKQEFRDALRLRYGMSIQDMPKFCACGKTNSINHTLDCKLGGYAHLRHDAVRDTEARLMREIARDVRIEPGLQDISSNIALQPGTNTADQARLDVAAKGIFSSHETTFFDVRVTNPNAPSNSQKSLKEVYLKNEKEKMTKYNDRVIQIEKASFIPLVYTTSGGMGPQCEKVHKRIAHMIAEKKNERYGSVISHIRTRLRFALLRSTLTAIRGTRGKKKPYEDQIANINFNLIPYESTYEGY